MATSLKLSLAVLLVSCAVVTVRQTHARSLHILELDVRSNSDNDAGNNNVMGSMDASNTGDSVDVSMNGGDESQASSGDSASMEDSADANSPTDGSDSMASDDSDSPSGAVMPVVVQPAIPAAVEQPTVTAQRALQATTEPDKDRPDDAVMPQ